MTELIISAGHEMKGWLLPGDQYNEHGYFEFVEVMLVNDCILAEAGGSWDSPPPKKRVRGFETINRAVVKDPRFCLTFPAWDFNGAKFIRVKRQMEPVVKSLQNIHPFSWGKCERLYKVYNQRMDAYVPDAPIVWYEDIVEGRVEALEDFLGAKVDKGLIDPRLNHGNSLKI